MRKNTRTRHLILTKKKSGNPLPNPN